jgi:LPXTG-motif cell wall-anchored protein
MVYDATGSYNPLLTAAPVLVLLALGALILCFKKQKA